MAKPAYECILVRYGEIALKGKNRKLFEMRLVNNIRHCMNETGIEGKISVSHGKILVHTEQIEAGLDNFKRVFGIVSLSPCIIVKPEMEEIKNAAIRFISELEFDTFRVSARRSEKDALGKKDSLDINKEVGAAIVEKYGKKVSLSKQDLDLQIDIAKETLLYFQRVDGYGGLPVGIEGSVASYVDAKRLDESVLCAWLMLKRGCAVNLVYSEGDADGAHRVREELQKYSYGKKIKNELVSSWAEAAKESRSFREALALSVPEDFKSLNSCLSTEDALGLGKVVLRPLVGYSPAEVNEMRSQIGGKR